MRTDYLTDIRDINYDLLPEIIRNEFEKVRLKYYNFNNALKFVKNYEFGEISDDVVIDVEQTKINNRVLFNKNLYVSIENEYDNGFKNSLENEDYLFGIKKKADKVLNIFATIYNKLDYLYDTIIHSANEIYKQHNLIYVETLFYQYGSEVGKFIKGWQLILNNFNLFEDIFNKYYQTTDIEIDNTKIGIKNNQGFFCNNGYVYFMEYQKHIVEPYVDFSYLFQRMLNEEFINKIKHLDFAKWLFLKNHINQKTLDLMIKNNGFRSLNKSFSDQRYNNFNIVFNL